MGQVKTRILVIEDEFVIGALLQDILEEAGFEVEVHETGAKAIKAQHSRPADLVIVDYGLPDQNGLEVCEQLSPAPSGNRPRTILATGWAMLEEEQYSHLVDLLLEKPFNMQTLLSQVEGLIAS